MRDDELYEFVKDGEGQYVEFKQTFDSADSIAAEIVAFLNSEGGLIIFGVSDDGEILGIENKKELKERLVGVCRNNCAPSFVPTIDETTIEDKEIVILKVPKGIDKPYCTNRSLYYIRAGAQKRRTTKEELGRLFQMAGFVHYDVVGVPNTSMEDLDLHRVEKYFQRFYGLDIHKAEIALEKVLTNVNILGENGWVTVGGVLFFTDRPADILFQTAIMAVRYKGVEITEELIRSKTIESPLPEAIDQALDFVMNNVEAISYLEGARRIKVSQYPEAAVKEAITNAVAHRNYSINGSRIRILIFDDRIEVKSPGRLPNTVTLDNIRYGTSFSRNQFIVKLLNNYGYIDLLGQGVPMIIKEMKKHSGHEPCFEEYGEEFRVILYGKERSLVSVQVV